jgi:hypothetical protein
MCRGSRHGTTSTASKRMAQVASSGWRASQARRREDAAALIGRHREGSFVEAGARLDLHEHQKIAPARDDVDLADRAFPAPRRDPVALRDQQQRGAALGRQAARESRAPLRRAGARRLNPPGHRCPP